MTYLSQAITQTTTSTTSTGSLVTMLVSSSATAPAWYPATITLPVPHLPAPSYRETFRDGGDGVGFIPVLEIKDGFRGEVALPDGAVIEVEAGAYRIRDDDAKIVYKANRVREFNEYLNVSDILEQFVGFMGQLGARQGDVLNTPIETFINWVIMQAAMKDGDPVPDDVAVALGVAG